MKKTNIGLVEHAKKILESKAGYVWGTFCIKLTETLLNQKIKQYPSGAGKYKDFIIDNYMNRIVTDCVGLIKGYVWTDVSGAVKYNSSQDISADMMFNRAKVKGVISTIPEVIGLCVWHKGHIGVYIGDGWVIEAHGTKFGVIQTPLKGNGSTKWTHWLECPYIQYIKPEKQLTSQPQLPTYLTVSLNSINYPSYDYKIIDNKIYLGARDFLTQLGYKNITGDMEKLVVRGEK